MRCAPAKAWHIECLSSGCCGTLPNSQSRPLTLLHCIKRCACARARQSARALHSEAAAVPASSDALYNPSGRNRACQGLTLDRYLRRHSQWHAVPQRPLVHRPASRQQGLLDTGELSWILTSLLPGHAHPPLPGAPTLPCLPLEGQAGTPLLVPSTHALPLARQSSMTRGTAHSRADHHVLPLHVRCRPVRLPKLDAESRTSLCPLQIVWQLACLSR